MRLMRCTCCEATRSPHLTDIQFQDISILKILYEYISFVRLILESYSVVWNPVYNINDNLLEKVQKKLMKSASYIMAGI